MKVVFLQGVPDKSIHLAVFFKLFISHDSTHLSSYKDKNVDTETPIVDSAVIVSYIYDCIYHMTVDLREGCCQIP